jgi:hypothetical protein
VHVQKPYKEILRVLKQELKEQFDLDHEKLQFKELINQAQDYIGVENWEELSSMREKVMALASEMGVI